MVSIITHLKLWQVKLKAAFTGRGNGPFAMAQPDLSCLLLGKIMEEENFAHQLIPEDRVLLGCLEADQDFGYDVAAIISTRPDLIQIQCLARDLVIPNLRLTEALRFCNKWNAEKIFPKVYIDPAGKIFIAEYNAPLDHRQTSGFLKYQVLRRGLGTSWAFFVEAGRLFT